jgi:hypothetical protein
MGETELRWGIGLDRVQGRFLLGANINVGKEYGYLLIYLGFWTLVIGKDYFDK